MKELFRYVFVALLFGMMSVAAFAQANDEPKQVAVFVFCDESVTTPVNAMRAKLTSTLVNEVGDSYQVVDRTAEILSALKSEYNYQGSGLVRDDQLVSIGEHLGAYYLCVVSVTYYSDFNQYTFECKLVNIETRRIEKQSMYPDDEDTMVSSLSPQMQYKVGSALSKMFKMGSASSPSGHGSSSDYPYVDLGLSVKWATCNLGASRPEEYGDYYAWGETATKTNYDWGTYKWCKGAYNKLTKYCPSDKSSRWAAGHGSPDGKTSLDLSDDVAHIKLGGKWRMPSDVEWTELRERCKWTWTSTNGVPGYQVAGPNGNSIFLPAAGIRYETNLKFAGSSGYYWSSSLGTDYPLYAWLVGFISDDRVGRGSYFRSYGFSVRPVTE